MRVTVLGNNGPFPEKEGACSSYLFSHSGQFVLCDMGAGSLQNLRKLMDPELLDVIILTHLHFDHISDFLVLRYYFAYLQNAGKLHKRISLYLPEDPLCQWVADDEIFDVHFLKEDVALELEGVNITFSQANHPVPCYSVCFQIKDRKIVYTSDTVYTEKIVKFSHKADLLIADSGLLNGQKGFHLTAGECGKLAKEAHAKALLLTHLNPFNDRKIALEQAKMNHENTQIAQRMQEY